ncbi:MAG: amidase [Bryobacteraceae bacterium]
MKRFLSGETTVDTYRRRIAQGDSALRAFSQVIQLEPLGEGPLRGAPFGVKDIFDAAGTRTEWGSPLNAGRVSPDDSALVRELRENGGRVAGKTHTTAFAYFDSAPTVNPYNAAHTPGGSSSGSAAAVAAGMVPFALGSQTQGSVCRPASYCGVAGFKPTFGLLPLAGVMPFAPSLDTAGLFTQDAADMALLWELMGYGRDAFVSPRVAAFLAIEETEPEMRAAFDSAVAKLAVPRVDPPESYRRLFPNVRLVQAVEGGRTLEETYRRHGLAVGTKLADMIEMGLSTPEEEYQAALADLVAARRDIAQVFAQYDVILTPAALGPAPATLASTGDPRANSPWTGLHTPVIAIPMETAGLPLGIQLSAASGRDAALLAAAVSLAAELSNASNED